MVEWGGTDVECSNAITGDVRAAMQRFCADDDTSLDAAHAARAGRDRKLMARGVVPLRPVWSAEAAPGGARRVPAHTNRVRVAKRRQRRVPHALRTPGRVAAAISARQYPDNEGTEMALTSYAASAS